MDYQEVTHEEEKEKEWGEKMREFGVCESIVRNAVLSSVPHDVYLSRYLLTLKHNLDINKTMLLEVYHDIINSTSKWILMLKHKSDNCIEKGNENIEKINKTVENQWYQKVMYLEQQKNAITTYLESLSH